jgi:hypothetical protein
MGIAQSGAMPRSYQVTPAGLLIAAGAQSDLAMEGTEWWSDTAGTPSDVGTERSGVRRRLRVILKWDFRRSGR